MKELNLLKFLEETKQVMTDGREGKLCYWKLNWKFYDGRMPFLFTLSKLWPRAQYLIMLSKYFIDEGKSGRSFKIFEGGISQEIALLGVGPVWSCGTAGS